MTSALAAAALLAGCPALVFDPPYRVEVGADAEATADGNASADAPVEDAGEETSAPSDGGSNAVADARLEDTAVNDGTAHPEAGCPGVMCNGTCMAGVQDCSGCAGKTGLCIATNTCQSGCGGCGSGVSCFMCPDGGVASSAPLGCGDGCLTGAYAHCGCNTATDCATTATTGQTCTNSVCTTCGEMSTGGQHCAGHCTPPIRSEMCVQSSYSCVCM